MEKQYNKIELANRLVKERRYNYEKKAKKQDQKKQNQKQSIRQTAQYLSVLTT